jgi:hypothetical protein
MSHAFSLIKRIPLTIKQHPFTIKHEILPLFIAACVLISCAAQTFGQQRRRAPSGGRSAVVVDERLAALRDAPQLDANLLQRMSRGRMVSITGARRAPDGVTFCRVAVTRRTSGWVQSDALASPSHAEDDDRLLRLIRGSESFDRIQRARIFLDNFPHSPLRPAVLLLYGEEAEDAATKLSRDASRRLDEKEMTAGGAPVFTYFQNFNELDRYNRQGIVFTFDHAGRQFHYNGASWREILRRYPRSPEAEQARKHLDAIAAARAHQ